MEKSRGAGNQGGCGLRAAPFLQHSHAFLRGTIAKLSFRRRAITVARDEEHAAAVVPRPTVNENDRAHSTLANTRGTTCIRDYQDNIPDSGHCAKKASDAGCTDGMAATKKEFERGWVSKK